MQIIVKRHSHGREATVVQPDLPPGDYYFIEEAGQFYRYCYVHKGQAERTMVTLQASWDELAEKLKIARSNLKELLAAKSFDGPMIDKARAHIEVLQAATKDLTERDRDLFLNFENSPSDCLISAREPQRFQLV